VDELACCEDADVVTDFFGFDFVVAGGFVAACEAVSESVFGSVECGFGEASPGSESA
jgi:hypothetical protein